MSWAHSEAAAAGSRGRAPAASCARVGSHQAFDQRSSRSPSRAAGTCEQQVREGDEQQRRGKRGRRMGVSLDSRGAHILSVPTPCAHAGCQRSQLLHTGTHCKLSSMSSSAPMSAHMSLLLRRRPVAPQWLPNCRLANLPGKLQWTGGQRCSRHHRPKLKSN